MCWTAAARQPCATRPRQGHVEVLRLLLEAGAQIDASKGAELTALHDAAQNGHLGVADGDCSFFSIVSLG